MTDIKNENDINYDEYDTIFGSCSWDDWKKFAIIAFIVCGVYDVLRIIWLLLTLLFKIN